MENCVEAEDFDNKENEDSSRKHRPNNYVNKPPLVRRKCCNGGNYEKIKKA